MRPDQSADVTSLDAYRDAALRAGADAAERAFNASAYRDTYRPGADVHDRNAAAIRAGYQRLARAIRDGYDPDPE